MVTRSCIASLAAAVALSGLPVAAVAEPTQPDHPAGTVLKALDEPGTWAVTSETHSFPEIRAEGIEIDDAGDVWLSSYAFCVDDPDEQPVSCVWQPGLEGYSRHPVRGPEDSWEPGIEDFAVTPDGTMWAASYRGLDAFDGSTWINRAERDLAGLDVGPDGRVWGAGADRDVPPFLVSISDDEPVESYGGDPAERVDTWDQATVRFLPFDVEVTSDGRVWVGGVDTMAPDGSDDGFLVRFDGVDWETMTPVAAEERFVVLSLAAGLDGTLWALVLGESGWYLAQHEDGSWVWTSEAEGLPPGAGGAMAVGDDGTVWLSAADSGVVAYDGSTWTRYLEGAPICDLAMAPDGSIWAVGEGLFVIRP